MVTNLKYLGCIVSMSYLWSAPLVYGAVGSSALILNCLNVVPNLTETSFGNVFVTVNGHSHFFNCSL